ncbi:MAG: hypothetical protein Q7T96_10495 [Methylobacter sp.]|nr:hypothetical protein [Methylobacter sp.]
MGQLIADMTRVAAEKNIKTQQQIDGKSGFSKQPYERENQSRQFLKPKKTRRSGMNVFNQEMRCSKNYKHI